MTSPHGKDFPITLKAIYSIDKYASGGDLIPAYSENILTVNAP